MIKSFRVAMFLAVKAVLKGNVGITMLTIFMLTLVAMNLLFVPGLINGAVASSNTILMRTYSGDVIIEAEGDNPQISHVENLMDYIESVDGVVAATARNNLGAEITFGDERVNCNVIGVDPQRERAVFDVFKYMIEGNYLETRDREQVSLGIQIAGNDQEDVELYSSSLRHVHAGDKVLVTYSNGVKKQYTVKGIFDTGFIQTDLQVFVSDVEFQSVMPTAENKATSIRVKLGDNVDPQRVIE